MTNNMNILLYFGFFLALGSIVAGFLIEHGALASLWQLSSFAIVFGGTIGITLITYPSSSLKRIPSALKMIMFHRKHDHGKLIELLCDIDNKARKNGILSLEAEAESVKDPFLKKGLEFIADGVDPEYLRKMLENEIEAEATKYLSAATIFDGMGGTAPTMGVLGTVMGMTNVLAKMSSDMNKLGSSIAVAFIATLYGVGSANLLWLPLGGHIKVMAQEEVAYKSVVLEGLTAIQNGEPTSRLRDRLHAMFAEKNKNGGHSDSHAESGSEA